MSQLKFVWVTSEFQQEKNYSDTSMKPMVSVLLYLMQDHR